MVKLTVVLENTVAMPFIPGVKGGLLGEHGLSVLIEGEKGRWLYDTGRGKGLKPNLETLGIDPDSIQGVILSHGHLDHVSGLNDLLKSRKEPLDVYCHPDLFIKRYSIREDKKSDVGIKYSQKELEALGARFHFNKEAVQVAPKMWVTGEIDERHPLEKIREPFFTEEQGQLVPDTIRDEQALILETEKGLVVLTGCAHSGIISILNKVKRIFPGRKIYGVFGGLHLLNAGSERLELTIKGLKDNEVQFVAVGHCTGFYETAAIAAEMKDKFHGLNTGVSFDF